MLLQLRLVALHVLTLGVVALPEAGSDRFLEVLCGDEEPTPTSFLAEKRLLAHQELGKVDPPPPNDWSEDLSDPGLARSR